jgi:hypothetical protein
MMSWRQIFTHGNDVTFVPFKMLFVEEPAAVLQPIGFGLVGTIFLDTNTTQIYYYYYYYYWWGGTESLGIY